VGHCGGATFLAWQEWRSLSHALVGPALVSVTASVVFAAARMIVSGHVRLHLWDIAYRHVATLGPLLLVQTVAALMGAIALALSRRVIVPLGSTLLMAGTIIGFILADTVGLSGSPSPK